MDGEIHSSELGRSPVVMGKKPKGRQRRLTADGETMICQSKKEAPHNEWEQDERAARIERLRRMIEDGTYEVSSEDVAEKIIDSFMRRT
jgi:anti-sigma28 factor (negative regulator of flagellin synthesis)